MIPFIIKKKLVNVPTYKFGEKEYEFYVLCSGFKNYDLQTFQKGDKIDEIDANDIEPTIPIAINGVSLKLSLCWCIDKVIKRKDDIIYGLRNDVWFNNNAQVVEKLIDNQNYNQNEPESETNPLKIENPEAIITECDYWLNLMINVDINDKHLIEEGIAQLDVIQHYWQNIEI